MIKNKFVMPKELEQFIEIEFARLKESVRKSFEELIIRNSKNQDAVEMK
jgi:hypothetical protein